MKIKTYRKNPIHKLKIIHGLTVYNSKRFIFKLYQTDVKYAMVI